MHLTDAVPVLAGAPSVVQEEGGNDLSRGQGDEFAAVTENCAMADFFPGDTSGMVPVDSIDASGPRRYIWSGPRR